MLEILVEKSLNLWSDFDCVICWHDKFLKIVRSRGCP